MMERPFSKHSLSLCCLTSLMMLFFVIDPLSSLGVDNVDDDVVVDGGLVGVRSDHVLMTGEEALDELLAHRIEVIRCSKRALLGAPALDNVEALVVALDPLK